MIHRRSFEPTKRSVTEARHFAQSVLSDLTEEVVSTVGLMVTELATNAVRHAATAYEVSIEKDQGGIHVEVADTGGGQAARRSPVVTEPSGRGLEIVAKLSDEWGVKQSSALKGKAVWFKVQTGNRNVTSTEQPDQRGDSEQLRDSDQRHRSRRGRLNGHDPDDRQQRCSRSLRADLRTAGDRLLYSSCTERAPFGD